MNSASLSMSPARRAWYRFRRNRLGYWSLLVFSVLVVACLFAEVISNDRPLLARYEGELFVPLLKDYPETRFGGDFHFAKSPNPSAPTADNWLGTDDRGRDLLAQLLYGFRVSVLFALALTATGVVLGVVTGAIQGFFGGKTDLAFQRFIEIWGSMPELYLLIIFSAVFAPSIALLLMLAEPVWLDGPVGLCARRISAQPPA
jgi:microcin C transport system permease protein